jgi:hypothetical protein
MPTCEHFFHFCYFALQSVLLIIVSVFARFYNVSALARKFDWFGLSHRVLSPEAHIRPPYRD